MTRWHFLLGLLFALTGYFGPWVDHRVAGLVITGLDFGEYVKFLPVVREGTVTIWRPGFYIPLIAVSAAASLFAYRPDFGYRGWQRVLLLSIAIVAALNLVPPAWTPTRLLEPEFRMQTSSLILLLVAVAGSPLFALLPHRIAAALVTLLALSGIIAPIHGFFQVLPAISELYNQTLMPGWGLWLTCAGLVLTALAAWRIPTHLNSDIKA